MSKLVRIDHLIEDKVPVPDMKTWSVFRDFSVERVYSWDSVAELTIRHQNGEIITNSIVLSHVRMQTLAGLGFTLTHDGNNKATQIQRFREYNSPHYYGFTLWVDFQNLCPNWQFAFSL